MIRPKISVLMSTHNDERFIVESIESILNQTLPDFEFIIVNDGSTDKTFEIIKPYLKKDKRIIYIKNKKNLGLIKSLNKGLKIAKGKYIVRMDADDVSMPERLEKQYAYMENHKIIFLSGTFSINTDVNGEKVSLHKPPVEPAKIKKELETRNCMRHSSVIFRNTKEYFYREKMWHVEDYDLYTRLITDGKKISNLPEFLIRYRIVSTSISFGKRGRQALFGKKAREFYMQRLQTSHDEYDAFNPNDIFNMDLETCDDSVVLIGLIRSNFSVDNFQRSRKFMRKYFKIYSVSSKPSLIVYYVGTFAPVKLVKIIRKILFKLSGRY